MNPTAVLIVEALVRYGPAVAKSVKEILEKPAPTQADWDALFAKVKTYDDYINAARSKP